MTDSTGSVTVSYTYDSFGNLIDSTGTSDNTYGFTGEKQFGEADGLVFLRARYYDPRIGRFISRDPMLSLDYYAVRGMDLQKFRRWQKIMKPRWLNPYVYCLNNPVNLLDPKGGCEEEVSTGVDNAVAIAKIIKESKDLTQCLIKCTEKFTVDEAGNPLCGPGNWAIHGICQDACYAAEKEGIIEP